MKLDIVQQSLIAAFLMLLVCGIAAMTRTYGLLSAVELQPDIPSLFGGYVREWQEAFPVIARLVSLLAIFYSGTLLGRMTVRYGLYAIPTYLSVSLYGILACGVFVSGGFVVEYLAVTLLVLAVNNYCACFRSGSYGFGPIFRASLYLGIIPLFYVPALVLMVVVPLVVFVFRRSARELLVAIVGYLLPFFSISYLNWAFGGEFLISAVVLWENFLSGNGFSFLSLSLPVQILLGLLAVLLVCSALCCFADMRISGQKSRIILFFNFILLAILISICFLPSASVASVAMAAAPGAVVLPVLFVRIDRRIAWLLYLGVVGLGVFCIWR